jgi:hypothetical protein
MVKVLRKEINNSGVNFVVFRWFGSSEVGTSSMAYIPGPMNWKRDSGLLKTPELDNFS